MKKLLKRTGVIAVLLSILLNCTPIHAAESAVLPESDTGQVNLLRNTYIRSCSAGLTISGSTATSTGYCSKYSDVSGDITIYVYLQKQSGSSWITVASSSNSFSGTSGSISFDTEIDSGTYRTKVSCWVNGENVTVESNTKSK